MFRRSERGKAHPSTLPRDLAAADPAGPQRLTAGFSAPRCGRPSTHRQRIAVGEKSGLEPPLTAEEVAAFREASRTMQDAFLRIGGPHARRILELLLATPQTD
jgi:hypothetical protein